MSSLQARLLAVTPKPATRPVPPVRPRPVVWSREDAKLFADPAADAVYFAARRLASEGR